jgi:outer membrane immunogenic protein
MRLSPRLLGGWVMRKIILAGILGFSALAPAYAADMPLKAPPLPVCDWCGGYLGLNLGGDYGRADIDPYSGLPFPPFDEPIPGVGIVIFPAEFATLPATSSHAFSVIGGGQAGYNWQNGHFVYGVEGDIDGTGLRMKSVSSLTRTFIGFPGSTQTVNANLNADINWIATVRSRFGYTDGRGLYYVTGGLAVAGTSVDTAYSIVDPPGQLVAPSPLAASASHVIGGWTLGVGSEWILNDHWSAGLEYRHDDFGTHGYNLGYSDASLVGFASPTTAGVHFSEDSGDGAAELPLSLGV